MLNLEININFVYSYEFLSKMNSEVCIDGIESGAISCEALQSNWMLVGILRKSCSSFLVFSNLLA